MSTKQCVSCGTSSDSNICTRCAKKNMILSAGGDADDYSPTDKQKNSIPEYSKTEYFGLTSSIDDTIAYYREKFAKSFLENLADKYDTDATAITGKIGTTKEKDLSNYGINKQGIYKQSKTNYGNIKQSVSQATSKQDYTKSIDYLTRQAFNKELTKTGRTISVGVGIFPKEITYGISKSNNSPYKKIGTDSYKIAYDFIKNTYGPKYAKSYSLANGMYNKSGTIGKTSGIYNNTGKSTSTSNAGSSKGSGKK